MDWATADGGSERQTEVFTLMLPVGPRFFKSLHPSVEISPSLAFNEMCEQSVLQTSVVVDPPPPNTTSSGSSVFND